jgi:hypothetical protein
MTKLKLDVDALEVESFASGEAPARIGTVRGFSGDVCSAGCPSFRICPPTDPSYNPCPSWDIAC